MFWCCGLRYGGRSGPLAGWPEAGEKEVSDSEFDKCATWIDGCLDRASNNDDDDDAVGVGQSAPATNCNGLKETQKSA